MLQRYELVFNYQILLEKNLFATCRKIIIRWCNHTPLIIKCHTKALWGDFDFFYVFKLRKTSTSLLMSNNLSAYFRSLARIF